MKCFEGYSIEHIKKMSPEEVKVLWDKFADETKVEACRAKLVEVLELGEAIRPGILGKETLGDN